jgi:hypothetical protein
MSVYRSGTMPSQRRCGFGQWSMRCTTTVNVNAAGTAKLTIANVRTSMLLEQMNQVPLCNASVNISPAVSTHDGCCHERDTVQREGVVHDGRPELVSGIFGECCPADML